MIHFFCPTCNGQVSHAIADAKVKCPHCRQKLRVPALDASGNKTVLGSLAPTAADVAPAVPVAIPYMPPPGYYDGPNMAGKFCRHCGAVIPTQAALCLHCGGVQVPDALISHPQSGFEKAHRGAVILTLGILSLVVCPLLGPFAWSMANSDLDEMRRGVMDPSGEGMTNGGKVCGIVATILLTIPLAMLAAYLFCCVGLLFMAGGGTPRGQF